MEEITKKDEGSIEIASTEIKTVVVDLDSLIYDRDSLVRTIENNYNDMVATNAKIQTQVDELNAKIAKAIELGVKTDAEIVNEQPPVDKISDDNLPE